jgi:hypothetical protein
MIEKALDGRRHGFANAKCVDASRISQTDAQPRRDGGQGNCRRRARRPGTSDEDVEREAYSALTA